MADKPSRGLVVYGDGLARFIDESHSHLHSFASRAYTGFLSLPIPPVSESEDTRTVREFLQLLDASEAYSDVSGEDNAEVEYNKSLMPTLSERFMGMKCAIITNNSDLKSVGRTLGLTVLKLSDLVGNNHSSDDTSFNELATKLLILLGFQERKVLETSQFDIVFVHIGDSEKNGETDIKFVNNLVGGTMQLVNCGSEIDSRLHMSLVMSYGAVSKDFDPTLSVREIKDKNNSEFSALFPRQSYTMKGRNPRNNVRHHCPMLVAQWQNAVTRKDMVEAFSFKEFREHGGMLTIPADRFIHEIAFKLWKVPKYGA